MPSYVDRVTSHLNAPNFAGGVGAQAVVKVMSTSPPDLSQAFEVSTIAQGGVLTVIYVMIKEAFAMLM